MIRRKGGLLILMLGIFITAGLGVAGAQFADNPSPFPFVAGPDGTGIQLSGVLVSEEGTLGSGSFFRQEFVTITPTGGTAGLFIHDIMEDGASGSGNHFLQESFVAMGNQRNPFTNQTNTSMPTPTPPGFTMISFRQTMVAGGLTMSTSLDPGEEILIDQSLTGIAITGQEPGTAASTIRIAQNGGAGLLSCGTGPTFCTTLDQTVDVQSGGVSVFNQNITFTTGSLPTITQIP